MDVANKENCNLFDKSAVELSMKTCLTPQRTPLQVVNNQEILNRSTKKAYYSQITPVIKTPGHHKSSRVKLSSRVYQDPAKVDDVLLNSLVCKKVQEVISRAEKDFEERLKEKEKLILDLTNKIELTKSSSSCNDGTDTDNSPSGEDFEESVRCYVDQIIDKCVSDLQQEQITCKPENTFRQTSPCLTSEIEAQNCSKWDVDTHCNLQEHKSKSTTNTENSIVNKLSCDVGCSPLRLETKEIGTNVFSKTCDSCCSPVQTGIKMFVDSAVSPKTVTYQDSHTSMDNSTCDAGLQTSVDTCDVCVMFHVEQDCVACSPFTNRQAGESWYMKDKSVSPISSSAAVEFGTMTEKCETPTRHNASVQAASELVSVMCSPIITSSKDCGMMAVPHTCNAGTDMPAVVYRDSSVNVKPETRASSTMTERRVKTAETSMTPVKVQNKDGHRLTAEEVRKQHPRALANQLDTMTLTTQRLHKELMSAERERDHFKHKISDLRTTLREKQKNIDEGNKKMEGIKEDLTKEHGLIVEGLEETIKSKNEQISDLQTDIENLERKLAETAVRNEVDTKLLLDRCDSLLEEQETLRKSHELQVIELRKEIERRDCTHQLKTAHALIQELQGELSEYTELADSLALAETLQTQIQEVVSENYRKVQSAANRLFSLKKQTDIERMNVMAQKKDNEEEIKQCKKEQEDIMNQYDSMKSSLETSCASMVQLDSLYKSTSADLLCATNQVQILSSELVNVKKAYDDCLVTKSALVERVEDQEEDSKVAFLEIQRLQASLHQQETGIQGLNKQLAEVETKYREEIGELQKERNQMELLTQNLQRTLDSREEDIDHLESDLFELREYFTDQMDKMDKMVIDAKSSAENYKTCQAENLELRDRCAVMQSKIQELKETLNTSAYELSTAKTQASTMLQRQEEQLENCAAGIQELLTKMNTVLTGLHGRVNIKSTIKHQVTKMKTEEKCKKKLSYGRKSFVSQIFMAAAEGPDSSDLENSPAVGTNVSGICPLSSDPDSAEASPASVSRSKLGYSSTSAFAPVRSGNGVTNTQQDCQTNTQQDCHANTQQESHTNTQQDYQLGMQDPECYSAIASQLQSAEEYFGEIVRLANIIEEASRLSIEDLKGENEDLMRYIEQLENTQQELEASIQVKDQELDVCKETIARLEEQHRKTDDHVTQVFDQDVAMNMQSELTKLKSTVRALEGENSVLTDHIKVLCQGAGDSSASTMEVLQLRLRNQKLQDRMMKKDEYYEELSIKASRRMKTLEENWRRAEAEVGKFDELVQLISDSLSKRKDLLFMNPDLRSLLKIIKGHAVLPSEEKPKLLKSIKTVL